MTPSDIRDYVKVYNNFLSKEFCKSIVEKIKDNNWQTHNFSNYKNKITQHKNEFLISYDKNKLKQELQNNLWYEIEKYIVKDFKKFDGWFNGWNGYTEVRFNKYDKTTEMKEHCDHIHTIFDGTIKGIPTLSIVGCLNEDYEGGEFIMWQTEKIEIPEGAVLIFPSNFMYPHKVNPVTKGTRYSYVSWVY